MSIIEESNLGWLGVSFGVISMYISFKAVNLDEVTKGASIMRKDLKKN